MRSNHHQCYQIAYSFHAAMEMAQHLGVRGGWDRKTADGREGVELRERQWLA